ncbi:SulP family inorganic anion transporter [Polymorphobacter fuscus]|uniref:SulP family inorganic anion transporter n=1 Tax=Sandarakinorhabdus fusca TaxID=1439888 RepID=A0A7C9KWK2_9SPHN|nr:SulP family inorganic anion transporter [Polymorphobacter fuscus]KAB7648529.1 SulP family inorganic anion transporter [Polymorphobacter fuscus]MQT16066.1 SulP family inorganic anion transporter [Polymorphobacter fuscus]NJC07656.1 carbonic anhydrase [Polymorphobacter fuscus]
MSDQTAVGGHAAARKGPFSSWRTDLPASIVVALVALPLCLGVALASGAPLFAGLIAGVVGGVVVGLLSKSPLSVSGPAAGLTAIVFTAIESLPSYETFLLAVVLAGIFQIGFSLTKGGVLAEFVPSSVITGMLAAIGLILILKQLPHAVGYDGDPEGSFTFWQRDGSNTLTVLFDILRDNIVWGAALIAAISLAFLFWWDKARPKEGPLRLLPGPLVVVAFGIGANTFFQAVMPELAVAPSHLVRVPISESPAAFFALFRLPEFASIGNGTVWTVALTVAIVASLESLLSVKAVDELDPERRVTDKNRELLAQGAGNLVSGLIGGIPVTSVIVRSSANVEAGAQSRLSTILHSIWLLLSIALIPFVLNLIPLSALAAVLIATGYKLAKPKLFTERWKQGMTQFIPFVATVVAILLTDLLIGIVIGILIGLAIVIWRSTADVITYVENGDAVMVRAKRNLYFIHKVQLQAAFERVPNDRTVLVDMSDAQYVDLDNVDIINTFVKGAPFRNLRVVIKSDPRGKVAELVDAPLSTARAT